MCFQAFFEFFRSDKNLNLSRNISLDSMETVQINCSMTEIDGDLFTAPTHYCLAHCVSSDMVMGAGIAVQFKKKFKKVKELLTQKVRFGGVAVLDNESRFIYYLVTKEFSYERPTYSDLTLSLRAMHNHMIENNIQHLAMPKIGCGIDGLQWDKVKDIITEVFSNSYVEIVIYNYVP